MSVSKGRATASPQPAGQADQRIADGLNRDQVSAMLWLSADGYRVGGFRFYPGRLSQRSERDLRDKGLLEEHWTWASTTRPDLGLSDLGKRVRTALAKADGAS